MFITSYNTADKINSFTLYYTKLRAHNLKYGVLGAMSTLNSTAVSVNVDIRSNCVYI